MTGSIPFAIKRNETTAFTRGLLDDVDAAAARATLDLGDAASLDVGTTAGTVAAGDDSRFGGSGDALVANPLSQFAATTSAQLAGVISDETGTGALVFANTPTLVTPAIGSATGTSLVLSGPLTLGVSCVLVGGTNLISQRNGANPQESRIHEQYTSDANQSYLSSRARTGANFEIGPVVDGATQRGLTIGRRATSASAITPWLTFANNGEASLASNALVSGYIQSPLLLTSDGALRMTSNNGYLAGSALRFGISDTTNPNNGTIDVSLTRNATGPKWIARANGGLEVRNFANTTDANLTAASTTLSGLLKFTGYTTALLPVATANEGAITYDTTLDKHVGSNGTTWNVLW